MSLRTRLRKRAKGKKNKRTGQGKHRPVEKHGDEELLEKREAAPTAQASELSWRSWVLPVDNHADLLSRSLLPC